MARTLWPWLRLARCTWFPAMCSQTRRPTRRRRTSASPGVWFYPTRSRFSIAFSRLPGFGHRDPIDGGGRVASHRHFDDRFGRRRQYYFRSRIGSEPIFRRLADQRDRRNRSRVGRLDRIGAGFCGRHDPSHGGREVRPECRDVEQGDGTECGNGQKCAGIVDLCTAPRPRPRPRHSWARERV